ncbi:MAG: cyclic nucleotide-binding domain-containing protein [bacterium]
MDFLTQPYMMAWWYGAFSALSLPLGALIGICVRTPARVVAGLMSFGAGALLAALTFELVSPAMRRSGFPPLAVGCLFGCVVFVALNHVLNGQGAFLRKHSTLIAHLKVKKRGRFREMVSRLSSVELFRSLPPEEVQEIIPHVEDRTFSAGDEIFDCTEHGDALYIIERGRVRLEDCDENGVKRSETALGEGESFGEMALMWDVPPTARAVAETDVKVWEIHREDFDDLVEASAKLRSALMEVAKQRQKKGMIPPAAGGVEEWVDKALAHVHEETYRPTSVEMKKEAGEKSGAALAMWLGVFLDGIPESLVIGASMIKAAISPALIGGLFLANLPESMSSAALMKRHGSKSGTIFWMWASLMIMTGVGALLGNLWFQSLEHRTHSFFEALAAGSMLAMIAQTMLPEAYEHGGWLVGVLTVLGFLAALFFHSLQMAAR